MINEAIKFLILESFVSNEAKSLGLEYYGFGRYGKNNKISHHIENGRLVPIGEYRLNADNDARRALDFADVKHDGQFRKATGDRYVEHPKAVAAIVQAKKKSKNIHDLIVASLLHDTLEDTDTTYDEIVNNFGTLVGSLVKELTNDEESIKKYGKLEYHKQKLIQLSSYALVIKLADRLHNISDHPTEKMVSDTVELMGFLKANRKLSSTQESMINEILDKCK